MACICIIGIHVTAGFPDDVMKNITILNVLKYCIHAIFRIGLPVFTILSGTLLLSSKKEETVGIFYYKRLVKIVIPFLIISLFYSIWVKNNYQIWYLFAWVNWLTIIKQIPQAILDTFQTYQSTHLWYVYYIMGIYLVAPFFKIMVQHMNEEYQKKFVLLTLVMRGIYDFMPLVNMNFGISYFVFSSGIMYFILGYILIQKWVRKYDQYIMICGVLAYFISIIIYIFFPKYVTSGIYDDSPLMIFQACAFFVFFYSKRNVICSKKYINKIVYTLSKHTFSIYLIHEYVRSKVMGWSVWDKMAGGELGKKFCAIFIILLNSYIIAIVLDNFIFKNIESIMLKPIEHEKRNYVEPFKTNIRCKKIVVIFALAAACIMTVVIVKMELPYGSETVTAESSDVKEMIKLDKDTILIQKFSIPEQRAVKLASIETILVNITDKNRYGELFLKILDESGKIIYEKEYPINNFKIGDYQKIVLDKPIKIKSNHQYMLQIEIRDSLEAPYLLLQDSEYQNRYNKLCYIDGVEADGTLLVNYTYYGYFPNSQKIILILLIFMLIIYLLFSQGYIKRTGKEKIFEIK